MPRRSSRSRSPKKSTRRSSRSKTSKGGVKLSKVTKSPIRGKKYRAHFSDGTHTDFGATGYSDFTKHRDSSRKQRYISRHSRRENWKNKKSAGALSRYILWNKPSLRASISDYKRRFRA
jgi:hypothetical protein